jgi:L-histidine N-alpha-methyltransferase
MARRRNLAIDVVASSEAMASVAGDVRRGLTSTPKFLPSKYFYDERGSRLFERITTLPEYYLTRAESALLARFATTIMRLAKCEELVELGSGEAKKTTLLIEAGLDSGTLRRFIPFEVSRETIAQSAERLATAYPWLEVHAVVGDFERHLDSLPPGKHRLIAFLGSTIGNFRAPQAVQLLRQVKRVMRDGDWFLLGTDLIKNSTELEAAYNDSAGVTAEFNLNILNVVNHHLDGDFDTDAFEHVAVYNDERSCIESGLRSIRTQTVRLQRADLEVEFEAGELLSTEVSCKYTRESAGRMLAAAGFTREHWFTDDSGAFALSLSR